MKKTIYQKIIFVVFILTVNLSLAIPLKAAETTESIKASYKRFFENLDLKYIDKKIPFLLKTEWDQAGIYARYTPTRVRVGCWSTAVAQIFYYHKLLPKSTVSYQCEEGYQINENLESYQINWDMFVNKIDDKTSEESVGQVAKYSYLTAVAMRKDFGTGHHNLGGNGFKAFKNILETHFDCIVNVYQYDKGIFKQEKSQIVKIIRKEVKASRPVALWIGNPKWGHAVVIDGYLKKGDLFLVHINQGMGGPGNGVYDLFSPIVPRYGDMYWREILTIKPKRIKWRKLGGRPSNHP
jgi:hypothetical protein